MDDCGTCCKSMGCREEAVGSVRFFWNGGVVPVCAFCLHYFIAAGTAEEVR